MSYTAKDLFEAIKYNKSNKINEILSAFENDKENLLILLSSTDKNGYTPLDMAALNCDTETLELIINKLSPAEANKGGSKLYDLIGKVQTMQSRVPYSYDDLATLKASGENQPSGDGSLFLNHDGIFNNQQKLDIQDAFAYTVLINAKHLMPSVLKVSEHFLNVIGPTLEKYATNKETLSQHENNLVEFFLAPMLPSSSELGSMPKREGVIRHQEVAQWLIDILKSPDPQTLYTHLRCHIRYSHFMSEEANKVNKDDYYYNYKNTYLKQAGFEKLHGELDYYIKERNELGARKQTGNNSISTKTGICNHHSLFTQHLAKKIKMADHYRAAEAVEPRFNSSYNFTAVVNNIPLISGPSGAMMHLLIACQDAQLPQKDMQYYHLAALGHLIGGGFHSLSECLSISSILLKFENQSYKALVPKELHKNFSEFFKFAANCKQSELWVTSELIGNTNLLTDNTGLRKPGRP